MRPLIKRLSLMLLVAAFGMQSTAFAGVIGTEAMLAPTEAEQVRLQFQQEFARDDVRAQLQAYGVDPDLAAERAAALSDEEILELAANMQHAPAGSGVLTVLGVTFVVLLVLELLGVIDVFKGI